MAVLYQQRRERVFTLLAGIFLSTLTMLNLIGLTRFIDLSFTLFGFHVPMIVAVGVLPYPITFLCTDLISELYGKEKANFLVLAGLMVNRANAGAKLKSKNLIYISWARGKRRSVLVLT